MRILTFLPTFACAVAATLPAQSQVTVPAVCATLPGNAALSLPLRWSQGTMQVRIDQALLPTALQGQTITGLHLRRPSFLFEPAYPAVQRTLTVRGAFQGATAAQMTTSLVQNRLGGLQTLFGPAPVNSPATPVPGPAASLGQEVLHVVFATPLPVVPGALLLEFETSDAPLVVLEHNWVDAVWFVSGVETGYAVTVGDGSCTTRTEPTELSWNDTLGPRAGTLAKFKVEGAPPTNGTTTGVVLMWLGVDPMRPLDGTNLGYGTPLTLIDPTLVGCHIWAPLDVMWAGTTDVVGGFATTFQLNNVTAGLRLGAQAAWLDSARTGLQMSFSNGLSMVLDGVGVGASCSTVFFPAALTTSPWSPFVGQMPVLTVDY